MCPQINTSKEKCKPEVYVDRLIPHTPAGQSIITLKHFLPFTDHCIPHLLFNASLREEDKKTL